MPFVRNRNGVPVVGIGLDSSRGLEHAVGSWLCLAATPIFAVMAVLTTVFEGPNMFDMGHDRIATFGGMTVMYILMSVFHATPWLNLLANKGSTAALTAEVQKRNDNFDAS